jgi:hypothetical protein
MAVNYGWKIKVKNTGSRNGHLRRSERKSKLERVPNEEMRRKLKQKKQFWIE